MGVPGAPTPPVPQAVDRIDQLEHSQAPQHLRRIEQVAGEHGDHALLQLPGIVRMAEHLAHDGPIEAVDKERESLHAGALAFFQLVQQPHLGGWLAQRDRKSTRLNSSHLVISYAVFCLKKKNTITLILHAVAIDRVTTP